MKKISELTLLTDQSTIKWRYMGEAFLFSCSEVDQVLANESRDLIFVLDQKKNLPERLTIINAQGKILSSFSPPDGGAFYYITVGSKQEVLIVCVFAENLMAGVTGISLSILKRINWCGHHELTDIIKS